MGAGPNGTAAVRADRRATVTLAYSLLRNAYVVGDDTPEGRRESQAAMRLVDKHGVTDDELRAIGLEIGALKDAAIDGQPAPESVLKLVERPKPRRAVEIIPDILAEAALPTITTGLGNLDRLLGGGLRARTMTVLVAGSGRGKTSLAAWIAAHHAEHHPVVYYSAELTPAQLVARVVAQRTGRSWRDVLTGEVTEDDMRRALEPLGLYVFGRLANPLATLALAIDDAIARGEGVPLLVVDYAQLVADVTVDMRISVMGAVRGVHQLTESRDIVTLLLAQGNRNSSRAMRGGEGSAVEYADAGGETAALEQSAATVIAVLYDPADGAIEHDVTLAVAKARYGATGKVGARFHGPSGAYRELDTAPPPTAEQARLQRILATLHPTEPRSRNDVYRAIGGRKEYLLESIGVLVSNGRIRELPGGALLLGSGLPGTGAEPSSYPQARCLESYETGQTEFRDVTVVPGASPNARARGSSAGSVLDPVPDPEGVNGTGAGSGTRARGTEAPPVPASAAPLGGGRPEPAQSGDER